MSGNLLTEIDHTFSSICLGHRFNGQVARGSRWISRTGDGPLYVLSGISIAVLDDVQGVDFFLACLLSFVIELPVYLVLKNTFKRARPSDLPCFIVPSDKYSLPSGHAAAAFVMASQVGIWYPGWAAIIYCWAAGIAISRVLLGVHFITDILAGAGLGILSAWFAMLLIGA